MTTEPAAVPGAVRAVRMIRWLGWCTLAWLAAMWFVLHVLGDRAWWTVALLFGPRWVLALPGLGLLPWLIVSPRRAALPTLAGLAIAMFPILGWHLPFRRANPASGIPYRVMQLNAGGTRGPTHIPEILAELAAQHPDLAVFVECAPPLAQALGGVAGYQMKSTGDFCMLVRGDVVEWQPRDQMEAWRKGGSGAIVRAAVTSPAGNIRLGLVHLATPRNALDKYMDLSVLLRQGPATRINIAQRDDESRAAHEWILAGAEQPTVVVGDFNLPVESAVYRRHWGTLRNAFGRAGLGTGYTKRTRFWGVRIDHVLMSREIGASGSFLGHDVGSDHLPVIADLVLPAPRSPNSAR